MTEDKCLANLRSYFVELDFSITPTNSVLKLKTGVPSNLIIVSGVFSSLKGPATGQLKAKKSSYLFTGLPELKSAEKHLGCLQKMQQ